MVETYAAPENPEKEPDDIRENRLKRKRQAKYRHYQKEQTDAGPSTRTRSKTSKASEVSSDTIAKTKKGKMDIKCEHCKALKWEGEKPGLCYINSEVILAPLLALLPAIYKLLTEKDPISKLPFVKQAIAYNQVFAFTSIDTKLDKKVANEKKRAYNYRI
ncbi:1459_t:CDS:2 [Dentiscutata erythropus]|uniref:1459_t:CDS:1 n=1 Tax=Dentiscutata erythropus TaxID=1348616 RepID=A0A9N9FNC6_9GLOM|nr:1459_t:CDS:2 [Dentiscutata erythropus]